MTTPTPASPDQSHLNRKYFLDTKRYNCPFCKRGSVAYTVTDHFVYNLSTNRTVWAYQVKCAGCNFLSLHLSDHDLLTHFDRGGHSSTWAVTDSTDIDNLFFHHQPTTFFTIDPRIPRDIRELIAEAEGCAKMGFYVGASGSLRKAIYHLLATEEVPLRDERNRELDYGDRVKLLKRKYADAEVYLDMLANIQDMTSKRLHEGEWEPWKSEDFKFVVETTKEALSEIYVKPREREATRARILAMKPKAKPEPKPDTAAPAGPPPPAVPEPPKTPPTKGGVATEHKKPKG